MAEQFNFAEGNRVVQNALLDEAQRYANAAGVQVTPEQLQQIVQKIRPTGWKSESNLSETDISNEIQKSREFLLPAISNYKFNPNISIDHTNNASRVLKEVFGRDATADEAAYFAKELAQGKTAYELSQELQSLPEYQKVQAAKDRASLGDELLQQQQQAFAKAQPAIISQFMRAGRLNSSGLNSALAQAQQELEQQRQGFLGQAGYQDASNIRNNAYNAFQNYNQQFRDTYNPGAQAQSSFNQLSGILGRQRELDDYKQQQNDYLTYLNMSKPKKSYGQLIGMVAGAGLGSFGGPAGAATGAQIGGAVGSQF